MPSRLSFGNAAHISNNPKPPTEFVTGAYDALPPAIRSRIEASVLDWNTADILNDLRVGVPERDILARIDAFEFAHAVMMGCPRI